MDANENHHVNDYPGELQRCTAGRYGASPPSTGGTTLGQELEQAAASLEAFGRGYPIGGPQYRTLYDRAACLRARIAHIRELEANPLLGSHTGGYVFDALSAPLPLPSEGKR